MAGLTEQIGPETIYPELTAPDVRWLASGLDTLAKAVEITADAVERENCSP